MGWSRNILLSMINSDAYARQGVGAKQHNFPETLPIVLAEQADEAMKDVSALDFLGITKPILERELERRMVNQIKDVLLEFEQGFTFMGNQFNIKLADLDYFIDLLFFHR